MMSNESNSARENILNAAKKLFLSNGYKKTTMRDIAAEANENLGLIVYYFKSKDKLAKTLIDSIINGFVDEIKVDNDSFNSLEVLFYNLLTLQAKITENVAQKHLFEEALIDNIYFEDPHEATVQQYNDIVLEYGINLPREIVYRYVLAGKGAERVLIEKKINHQLDITYLELCKMVFDTSVLPLGIPRVKIDLAFDNVTSTLDKKYYDLLNT